MKSRKNDIRIILELQIKEVLSKLLFSANREKAKPNIYTKWFPRQLDCLN